MEPQRGPRVSRGRVPPFGEWVGLLAAQVLAVCYAAALTAMGAYVATRHRQAAEARE